MRIAVDARMINMSGIGVYIKHLIENGCYPIVLGNREEIKINSEIMNIIEFNSPIYGIKEQFKFPYNELKKLRPDILHIPHYNIPIFYTGKMVVTIHDLTHLVFPEFLPSKFAYYYAKFMFWFATKRANKIITDSENTKRDILERYNVNPDKIEVIYLGVGEEFVKKEEVEVEYLYDKFSIPRNKKILMYVGNLKPHKNLERLLIAFSQMENKQDYCMLLIGKAFEKYNVLEQKEKELGIDDYILHTGMVNQEELVDLYNLADLFVFPSLYEGFGIPVLEALACGTPVICSNTSSLPEVGSECVNYFNPVDVEQIMQAIQDNINRKSNREIMSRNIKYTQKFNWKSTSKKTLEVMNNI